DLQVDPAPGLSKAFAPTQIFVGQTSTVTLSIDNSSSQQAVGGLAITDTLPAGLLLASPPATSNSCGGTLSAPDGGSTVSLNGGSVPAGASCTISFDVIAVSAGTLVNTTSPLQSNAGSVMAASDTLQVDPVPLLSKSFSPNAVAVDAISQLSISIDNSGSTTALTGIAISDNLPAGMTLATPANASSDCVGGTLTAADGGGVISYSGGGLVAGASCSIQADVFSATPGSYVNTTGDLTSNAGNSGTASATLVVSSRPLLSKQFSPAAGFINLPVRLVLSIDHSSGVLPATALDLTDPLPAGLVIATPANAVTNCTGGALTATAGSGSLSYSGGSVPAGASCTIEVDVVAAAAGDYLNTTGDLLSSLGNSGNASATLRVDAAPSLSKAFAPTQIFVGQTSTVTLSIDNSSSQQAVGGLAITDTLPAGLLLASPPATSNSCGGSLQALAGGSSVMLSGGTVAAGSSCAVSFDVVAGSSGSLLNTTSVLTTDAGSVPPASASLQVEPQPTLSKAFAPTQIFVGGQASVVLTIDNPGALALTNVALTDDLPIGLLLTASPNAQTDCGGTLTAGAGAATVSLNSGALVAGGSCTISFDVQASVVGDLTNTTAPLQSSAGGTPTATATLRVNPVPAFSKRFEPELILADQTTTVILTIDNSASTLPVTGMSFSDDLPSGMFVAAPSNAAQDCGAGTLNATSGATLVSYSGGSVAAGAICTVRFDVGVMSEGLFDNVAGPLQTDVGLGDAAATARLTASPGAMPVPMLSHRAISLLLILMLALGLLGLRQRSD
ncbi:MAG: DUF11 domain-containing protein, partial [Xanthomonadales bacterium]|nr:DUF11 domain-containing protein [Xanthomonadales bacterium]